MSEDGEAVEGLIPKIQEAFDKYTGGSVSVIDKQNGGLNSTYEILQQLSQVYPTLSDEAKAYLNEAVAGNRQNKVLVSIMENWENVENATNSATDSLGSANAENEKLLNSIEGKTAQLTSSMQIFWKNLINSDSIKLLIDMLNTLVTTLDKLVNNSFAKLLITTTLITASLPLLSKGFAFLLSKMTATTIGMNLLAIAQGKLTIQTNLLTGAFLMSPFFKVALIVGGITAIVKAVDHFTTSFKEQQEIVATLSSGIGTLQSEYDQLLGVKDKTDAQKNRLALLKAELDTQKELLNAEQERLINQQFFNRPTRSNRAGVPEEESGAEKAKKDIAELIKMQEDLANTDVKSEDWKNLNEDILETKSSLIKQLKILDIAIATYEAIGKIAPKNMIDLANAIRAVVVEEEDSTNVLEDNKNIIESLDTSLSGTIVQISNFSKAMSVLDSAYAQLLSNNQLTASDLSSLQEQFGDTSGFEDFIKVVGNTTSTTADVQNAFNSLVSSYLETSDIMAILNDENKDLIVSQLELIGVTNAEEIVTEQLANNKANLAAKENALALEKEFVAKKGYELVDATWEEINALINSEMASEDTRIELAKLTLEKIKLSETKLDFNSDIDQIISLASAAGATISTLNRLTNAKEVFNGTKKMASTRESLYDYLDAIDTKNDITSGSFNYEYTPLNANTYKKAVYGGSKKGSSSSPSSAGSSSSPKSSSADSRQFLESIDAEIRAIKLKNDALLSTEESLKEQLSLAKDIEGMDGLNEQYRITGELIAHNTTMLESFKKEQELISARASSLRSANSKYDTTTWFDSNAEQTTAYIDKYNKATKDQQEEMSTLFSQIQSLKKAWMESATEVDGIVASTKELTLAQDDLIAQQRELARTKWIEQQNDLYDEQQERLQALESIQEKIIEIIRKRGEEEKKALDEAYNKDMKQLDERHNARKEKWAEELDEFKALIQGKLDALNDQFEQEDDLEQLNKEREEANRLQSEIDVLSLDDSLTARNQTIELRKQLADQNEKIAKLQQDKERDLLKQSLEDQLKNYEQDAKDKEDIADTSYENEKRRLEEDYDINKQFLDKKYSDEKVYAEARKSIMRGTVETSKGMFEDIYNAFEDFEDKFGKGMGILGEIIKKDFLDQLDLAKESISDLNKDYLTENQRPKYDSDYQPTDEELGSSSGSSDGSGGGIYMSKSDFDKYVAFKQVWEMANKTGNTESKRLAKEGADALRLKYKITSDKYSYDDLKNLTYDRAKFMNGGKLTQTGTGMIDIHGSKNSPEWIFNDSQLKNIVKDTILSTFKIALPKIPSITGAGGGGNVFNFDNLINVEGNVTKETIPLIKAAGNDIIETIKELNKSGIFRSPRR